MMKWLCCLLILLRFSSIHAQEHSGSWVWLSGDNIQDTNRFKAIRGTKGVPSIYNKPDGLKSYSFNWKDPQDKFWLFSIPFSQGSDSLEVWSYNWMTNMWTLEAGYDKLIIDGNVPDSVLNLLRMNRRYGDCSLANWVDSLGNLWYFHEEAGFPNTNDKICTYILKFNIQTKHLEIVQYRIKDFNYTPNYGTIHQTQISNWPLVFSSFPSSWVYHNKVFIFNGTVIYPSLGTTNSNELWEYDMSSGLWTWHGGDSLTSAVYGTRGVSSSSNWPYKYENTRSKWIKEDNLYFFGGDYRINNSYFSSNCIWRYNITNREWTWLGGSKHSDTLNNNGLVSSKVCVDSSGYIPSPRTLGNSLATSPCNNSFWYYSGVTINNSFNWKSDLWLYKPDQNRWVWVDKKSIDSTFYYGAKGVPNINNSPPARSLSIMWTDNLDRLYLFGGQGYYVFDTLLNDYYGGGNDLWRFDPDYSCINYNLSDKYIDRNIQYKLCAGDSSIIKIRSGFDSIRVTPMAGVSIYSDHITLTPTAPTAYKIEVFGFRCETNLDSLTVPISFYPTPSSVENKVICQGESYRGKDKTGTYTFTYPAQPCDSTYIFHLTVNPVSKVQIDTEICEGKSIYGYTQSGVYNDIFRAVNGCDSIRTINLTVIPRFLALDTFFCEGKSFEKYTVIGTYRDTVYSRTGCSTIRTIKLTERKPVFTNYSQDICEGFAYDGYSKSGIYIDTFFGSNHCDSIRTLNLKVYLNTYSQVSLEICRGDSFKGHTQAGIYKDTLKNYHGCDSFRTVKLTLRDGLILKKIRDTTACIGSSVLLNAGVGHRSYLWNTGATTPSILVAEPKVYTVNFVDSTGCNGFDKATVTNFVYDEVSLPDTIKDYIGSKIDLSPQTSSRDYKAQYYWTPQNLFNCDTCRYVQFKPTSSTVLTLRYTDRNGCVQTKSSYVELYDGYSVGFPSAFSPNGDSTNDFYFPNTRNIESYELKIFNRWGEEIFSTHDIVQKWDGRYKGVMQTIDNYIYVAKITLINGTIQQYQGTFQLLR